MVTIGILLYPIVSYLIQVHLQNAISIMGISVDGPNNIKFKREKINKLGKEIIM